MPRREPNHRLAALLEESGWSAADLARAVNALGAAQGLELRYERAAVAHWLAGSRPRGAVAHLAAQALSRRCRRLVTVEDTGLVRGAREQPLPRPSPFQEAEPVHHLNTLARTDADPARRAFLARTAYTLSAVVLPDWQPSAPPPPSPPRTHVQEADVQILKDMTQTFATFCDQYGGAHARTALATYLADEATTLAAAPAPAALHTQVLVQCARLTHVLANMTTDGGHQGLAQQYYRTALGLYRRAGDRVGYAVTLRAMSVQALRLGHTRHAGDLARAATDTVGTRGTPAAHAFLFAQRALTAAAAGDRGAALADLSEAEEEHGRAADAPGPFSAYPRAGLEYQRAQALHVLGDRKAGLEALRASVRHRSPSARRPYVLTRAGLAERLLDAGHLEEACAHCDGILDHYASLHSRRTDRALTQLTDRLRSFPRQRQAAEVLERFRELRAARGRRG